jgi:DNA modification methylase
MSELKIEYRSLDELRANPRNARVHPPEQIAKLAQSIRRFGFNVPILIDSGGVLVAGHGRLEAAHAAGVHVIPAVRLDHLTDTQARAFLIADNRLAELAEWDRSILAVELQELIALDLDFEVTDTGFEIGEIDVLLNEEPGDGSDTSIGPDDECELPLGRPVSRPDDLWLLGQHRLYCGNSLDKTSYDILLGEDRAEMVFTDPPYNVRIDGNVSGLGKARHREFAMASGEMTEGEFVRFLTGSFRRMAEASTDGSIHFVCMDWRHLPELYRAGRIVYSELKNLCVWDKGSGGMGSLYRSQHELVAVFKNGTGQHINNVELGRHGRCRSNVWRYGGLNRFQAGRQEALASHPTVKPVALIADAILDCSNPKGLILDPFAGSGTSIIAAQRARRRCAAIELDPLYVDVALRRFRKVTGIEPVHSQRGTTFSENEATVGLREAQEEIEREGT